LFGESFIGLLDSLASASGAKGKFCFDSSKNPMTELSQPPLPYPAVCSTAGSNYQIEVKQAGSTIKATS